MFSCSAVTKDFHPKDNLYLWGHYGYSHRGVAHMAMDADFRDRGGPGSPKIKPRKVDPIDELKRLNGDGA